MAHKITKPIVATENPRNTGLELPSKKCGNPHHPNSRRKLEVGKLLSLYQNLTSVLRRFLTSLIADERILIEQLQQGWIKYLWVDHNSSLSLYILDPHRSCYVVRRHNQINVKMINSEEEYIKKRNITEFFTRRLVIEKNNKKGYTACRSSACSVMRVTQNSLNWE